MDEFYVAEVGFKSVDESESPTWIKFVNETISTGLKFLLSPEVKDLNTSFELFIVLADNSEYDPQ